MSKEQGTNSSITERLTGTDVTEEEAFDCYRRMENPTPDAVAEHFAKLGRKLSCSRIKKWTAENSWPARLDLTAAISVIDPATVLDDLKKLANERTEDVMRGLAYHVIVRLAVEIDQLDVRDIMDFACLQHSAAELVKACRQAGPKTDKPPDIPEGVPIKFKSFERSS
jgi:hypothetical protein